MSCGSSLINLFLFVSLHLVAAVGFALPAQSRAKCVPAREQIKIEESSHYHKFHPSGFYALFSGGSSQLASLGVFTDYHKPSQNLTTMAQETAPVTSLKGDWTYLAIPILKGPLAEVTGTSYVLFKDILTQPKRKPVEIFRDDEFGEWYHTSAERPQSTIKKRVIRTLLYTKRRIREYTLTYDKDFKLQSVEKSPIKSICDNIFKDRSIDPEDKKKADKLTNEAAQLLLKASKAASSEEKANLNSQSAEKTSQAENILYGPEYSQVKAKQKRANERFKKMITENPASPELAEIRNELSIISEQLLSLREGQYLANPVLSNDGEYVVGLVKGTVHIYKIDSDFSCHLIAASDFRGSKAAFNYPAQGESLKVVFTSEAGRGGTLRHQVMIFDTKTRSAFAVSQEKETETYYPGFLLDGRVIYKTNFGFSVVDPNQIRGDYEHCIKH